MRFNFRVWGSFVVTEMHVELHSMVLIKERRILSYTWKTPCCFQLSLCFSNYLYMGFPTMSNNPCEVRAL